MPYMPDEDFGFSFEPIPVVDDSATVTLQEKLATTEELLVKSNENNRQLYRKISMLLIGLKRSPEQEMIKWPNRAEKIDAFLKDLEQYRN